MKTARTRILVAAVVLAVALVGCGRDGSDDATDVQTTPPTSTTAGTDAAEDDAANDDGSNDDKTNGNSDPDGTDSEGQREEELSWVPIGPTSSDIPDDERWYGQLVDHRCGQVGRGSDGSAGNKELLYQGLGKACSVLFGKQTRLWDDAQNDLSRGLDELAGEDLKCHDRAAVALARRLLELPDRLPRVKITSTPGTVCPWGIGFVDITRGPIGGDTEVWIEIDGDGLGLVTEVYFGDVRVPIQETSADSIKVKSPPVTEPGRVLITVRGRAGGPTIPSDFYFEYVDDDSEPDGNGDNGETGEPAPPEPDPTATPLETAEEQG